MRYFAIWLSFQVRRAVPGCTAAPHLPRQSKNRYLTLIPVERFNIAIGSPRHFEANFKKKK
jgi:hypothetical protein